MAKTKTNKTNPGSELKETPALKGNINSTGGNKIAAAVAGAKNSLMKAANNAKNAYQEAQGRAASQQARLADEREQQRQQEERERQMQEFLNNYAPSVDFMGVYNDYANRMGNILQQQKDALSQQTTSKARSAYVANEQSKAEIPRLLSNAGLSGGIAEKVRGNQDTLYQQNIANILSENATQGAQLERNNANLISEAYKEAMSNQQAVDNERALAAQQYANQLALQQQQQEYARQQAEQEAADSIASASLGRVSGDIYKKKNGKKVLSSSQANQIASIYNTAKSSGASQSTLNQLQSAMTEAATQRWNEKYGSKKNPSISYEAYIKKYVTDRIS